MGRSRLAGLTICPSLAFLVLVVLGCLTDTLAADPAEPWLSLLGGGGGDDDDDDPVSSKAGEGGLGAQAYVKQLWGRTDWPPAQLERRPPAKGAVAPWDLSLVLASGFVLAVLVAIGCLMSPAGRQVVPSSCRPTGPHVDPEEKSLFGLHFHALSSAIIWRHAHPRALILHACRVALPVVCLFLVYKARGLLAGLFNTQESAMMQQVTGMDVDGVVMAVVEYALTITMVYVAMLSMVFFVWHLTTESSSGFRHLLHVSGLSRAAYILATAGVDGFALAAVALLVMVVVSAFVIRVRVVLWTSPALLLFLLALLALSSISTGYLLALICPSPRFASTAAQFTMFLVIFAAPFAPMSAVVPAVGEHSWKALFLPSIPAYRALFELVASCVKGRCLLVSDVVSAAPNVAAPWSVAFGSSGPVWEPSPPESFCTFVFFVFVQLKLMWVLIYWLDWRQNPPLHDSGVAAKGGSSSLLGSGAALEVKNLTHRYGWLHKVTGASGSNVLNDVSFRVMPGTVLGLLGPNGSGKTTTIRCIIGEEKALEGSVSINSQGGGVSVGLCPQETCINGDLTIEENLRFFAFLRGATGAEAYRCVERTLAAMRLKEKRGCMPDTLSGGMRRRLGVGCAMIASPVVTILDEPTTGLDPVTRRGIWASIQEIMAAGGCCLLTTHMLEEAEELCQQLVILTGGRKVAEGSVQQLKEQFGTGYLLNLESWEGQVQKAKDFIENLLPPENRIATKVTERGQMTYRMTQDEEALGHLIICIARGKDTSGIKHWGVSQASLEDAYIRIIQKEEPQEDHAAVV